VKTILNKWEGENRFREMIWSKENDFNSHLFDRWRRL